CFCPSKFIDRFHCLGDFFTFYNNPKFFFPGGNHNFIVVYVYFWREGVFVFRDKSCFS
ncbi:MAG: hypothetical protein HN424_02170, partial [Candidatus Jacksonbacteria bacterium]|nr:hypothetical protein [Candidatus Jacksonbacteria bacterium]